MTISLIHPSRGRPDKAYETARYWIDRAGCTVEHIFSLDKDDPTSGDYRPIGTVLLEDNNCVVQATNKAAKEAKGDILIYLSDDFKCPDNWGPLVEKEFDTIKARLLKVDDCLQKFEVAVLTIPIMNRQLYERLGYFWHPAYKSMFVDEHLYWVCQRLGVMRMAPHLKFPHEHPANGKAQSDETYRRSERNWEQGKAQFAQHRDAGFPV